MMQTIDAVRHSTIIDTESSTNTQGNNTRANVGRINAIQVCLKPNSVARFHVIPIYASEVLKRGCCYDRNMYLDFEWLDIGGGNWVLTEDSYKMLIYPERH